MTLRELVLNKREDILKVAAAHGATNVRVFGSIARGQEASDSDVDFLIDTGEKTSAWFPAGLILELESLLGRHVDVVTERGLNPYIRDQVLREAIPLSNEE